MCQFFLVNAQWGTSLIFLTKTSLTSPVEQETGETVGSAHWEPAGHMVQVVLLVESA